MAVCPNNFLSGFTLLFDASLYFGWSAALASVISCGVAAKVLWDKVDDLLFQTFSKSPVETLPERVKGIPGVGRFRVKKGDLGFHVET